MLTKCEKVAERLLPAIKAVVAKTLAQRYSWTQIEIATGLEVTQAAVSKYLSGKYSSDLKRLEKSKEVQTLAVGLAQKLAGQRRGACVVCGHSGKGCGFAKSSIMQGIGGL